MTTTPHHARRNPLPRQRRTATTTPDGPERQPARRTHQARPARGSRLRVGRPSRRTTTIIATLTMLAALITVTLVTGRNHDEAPAPTTPTLGTQTRDALNDMNQIDQVVAPTKGNHTTLLTPAGPDWWDTAISLAPMLALHATPDKAAVPAPTGAHWYAITGGTSYASNSATLNNYQALHIGFPNATKAHAYATSTYTTASAQGRTILERGSIVTFAPAWLDPNGEPYRRDTRALNDTADLRPQAAAWHIDLAAHNDALFAQSPYKSTLDAAVEATGFVKDSTWTGTSLHPEGPWTGTLSDFAPDSIEIYDIGTILTQTNKKICDSETCIVIDEPLRDIAEGIYVKNPTTGEGWGAHKEFLPPDEDIDPDAILIGGISYGRLEGVITHTLASPHPPVPVIKFAVYDDNLMTLWTPTATERD